MEITLQKCALVLDMAGINSNSSVSSFLLNFTANLIIHRILCDNSLGLHLCLFEQLQVFFRWLGYM